jgi:flagellar biosynthesis component FlhA
LTLVREGIANLPSRNKDPLLLVNPKIRCGVQALIGNAIPGLRVLSFGEICDQTRVKSHGVICLPTEVVGVE